MNIHHLRPPEGELLDSSQILEGTNYLSDVFITQSLEPCRQIRRCFRDRDQPPETSRRPNPQQLHLQLQVRQLPAEAEATACMRSMSSSSRQRQKRSNSYRNAERTIDHQQATTVASRDDLSRAPCPAAGGSIPSAEQANCTQALLDGAVLYSTVVSAAGSRQGSAPYVQGTGVTVPRSTTELSGLGTGQGAAGT